MALIHEIKIGKTSRDTAPLKKKLRVCEVVDYPDRRFSKLTMEHLRENEKFAKPFLPVHMGPKLYLLSKKMVENLVTLSL